MADRVGPKKRGESVEKRKPMISKNDVRYWQARVRKAGNNAFYSIPIQHVGRRMELSLGTANLFDAATRAKERYLFLIVNGWDAFLAKYRPDHSQAKSITTEHKRNVTVGEYIDAVRIQTELEPKTIDDYAQCFRRILSDIFAIKGTKRRFDYRKGGNGKWLEKIHAIRLADIKPEAIRVWKKQFVEQAGKDEVVRRRYAVSCNSFLRRARALFSKRNVINRLKGLELPVVLPFDDIPVERVTSKFYGVAGIEPKTLLRDALGELGTNQPEELKAFLLGLVFGLRRKEADLLEWQSFDFANATLRIMPTKWFRPKTNESLGTLPVEPEFLPLFQGWKARAKTEFVIESDQQPQAFSYQWYRCQAVFDSLLDWLREKGITSQRPFHTLRKMYGSALNDLHGIHAASSGLRHSDIRTASEHYADSRVKLTAGFGSVLSAPSVTPLPAPAVAESDRSAAS
jgi:integrase